MTSEPKIDRIVKSLSENGTISATSIAIGGILVAFTETRDLGILVLLFALYTFYLNFINSNIEKQCRTNPEDLNKVKRDILLDRKNEAEKIVEKILSDKGKNRVNVLVGPSGSGKSILVRNFFPFHYDRLLGTDDSWIQIVVDDYNSIEKLIINELYRFKLIRYKYISLSESIDSIFNTEINRKIFFVFDQFESIFMNEPSKVHEALSIISDLFYQLKKKNLENGHAIFHSLIVVRKEWYVDLRFFKEDITHLTDTFIVDGLDISHEENIKKLKDLLYHFVYNSTDKSEKIIESIINDCSRELTEVGSISSLNNECKSEDGIWGKYKRIILPVEIMTVAQSYSISKRDSLTFNFDNREASLKRYFNFYLSTYPEKKDAMQILYALSVSRQEIKKLTSQEISEIVNIPKERVEAVLKYFSDKKIFDTPLLSSLKTNSNELYFWRHYFFAERYYEVSGNMLDPIDRDNINFFFDLNLNNKLGQTINSVRLNNTNSAANNLSTIIFVVSVLILLIRLILPLFIGEDFKNIEISSPLFRLNNFKWIVNVDVSFLPIAISLTLWSWYVTTAYRRLFSILNEENYSHSGHSWKYYYSIFVAVWSLICVILTVCWPSFWITFTGLGGLIIGFKYKQLTISNSSFEESIVKELYKETTINSVILIILGVLYALLFPPFNNYQNDKTVWIIGIVITAIFFFGMVYFAYEISIKTHTIPSRIPSYLGIYKRYRYDEKQSN